MENTPISTSKNLVNNAPQSVGGDFIVGDHTHYHITNAPFTLSSPRQFLARVSSSLLETTIPCFDAHQGEINDFFQNPHKRILIITGVHESGKTHLLRNLILEAGEQYQWHCAGIESHGLAQHPTIALPEDQVLLLFKDDIEWKEKEFLRPILEFIDSHPNTRLILTAHHSWLEEINREMRQIKDFPGKIHHIQLGPWQTEHLLQVFRLASKLEEVPHEEEIVRQFPNPYLLKYFGEAKVGNPQLDVIGVSRNFAEKIRRVFERIIQPELSPEYVNILIGYLIFNKLYRYDLTVVADQLGVDEPTLNTLLNRLKSAGIIRFRRGIWYIFPEVKGDFYLASQLESQTEACVAAFLAPHLTNNEQITISKVIETVRYLSEASRTTITKYFQYLLKQWQSDIQNDIALLHRQQIGVMTEILHIEEYYGIPSTTDAACIFIMSALSAQADSKTISASLEDNDDSIVIFSTQPTKREYAQFLEGLIHLPRKRDEYLSVLQEIWRSGWTTNTINYNPEELLANAFKPEYNTIDSYKTGLLYARSWLLGENQQLRSMGVKALQTMLGGFFEYIHGEYNSIIFGTSGLPDNADLNDLRTEALNIVHEAMAQEHLQLYCLRIMDDIGLGKRFYKHEDLFKLPSFPKIRQEMQQCIPSIGTALLNSNDFIIQKESENILLKWWLWGISDAMETWLLQFARTPEYLLYRETIDDQYIIEDFSVIIANAPATDRLEWYRQQSNSIEKRLQGIARHNELVRQLSVKYSTVAAIAQFICETAEKTATWTRIDGRVEGYSMSKLSQIIQCWTAHVPEDFKMILAEPTLSLLLPEAMRISIETQLLDNQHYQPHEIAESLLTRLSVLTGNEIGQLVFLIQKHQPPEKEAWLQQMIQHGHEEMLHNIASRLGYIFKPEDEIDKIAEYLLQILNSGKITREDFFARGAFDAAYTYHHLNQQHALLSPILDETLRQTTFDWIKNVSRLDKNENDIIHFCIRTADHLIELIDHRAANFSFEKAAQAIDFQVRHVLPENVFSSEKLQDIFQTPANHRRFIDKIRTWEITGGSYSPDWVNPYIDLKDPTTEELWLVWHLNNALQENDIDKIDLYIRYIPRDEKYILLMLNAWEKIMPRKSNEKMEILMYQWATYYGNSSRKPPKEFWELVSLQPISNLRLKMLIQKMKAYLEKKWQKEVEEED